MPRPLRPARSSAPARRPPYAPAHDAAGARDPARLLVRHRAVVPEVERFASGRVDRQHFPVEDGPLGLDAGHDDLAQDGLVVRGVVVGAAREAAHRGPVLVDQQAFAVELFLDHKRRGAPARVPHLLADLGALRGPGTRPRAGGLGSVFAAGTEPMRGLTSGGVLSPPCRSS